MSKKLYAVHTELRGRGITYYKSDKSPDEFDNIYDFIKQAEYDECETIETEVEDYDDWELVE